MLAVQVSYQTMQETIRHNKVAEQQNERALEQNDIKIAQTWSSLEETKRHNVAVETETARHNVATESLGYANLAYNYTALAETTRHNKAQEAITTSSLYETHRHNAAVEGVQWAGIDVQKLQLAETERANKARESENMRHNMETESIARASNGIALYRATVQEQQGWASIANAEEANKINQQNADTRAKEADISEQRMKADRSIGIWNTVIKGVDDVWSNLNTSFSVPAKYLDKSKGGYNNEQD